MKISINDKSLYSDNVPVRQYNNLVDTITLTIPRIYNGIDMSEATARIVAEGKPSLVEGVSDEITKAYTDTTITVMWDVARAYTETAGAVPCQMSLLDAEERALYTAIFTLRVLDSLTFSEWDGEDHTMWDDYLAQFNALVSHADEVDAKITEFNADYEDKLQAVKDTANRAIDDLETAQTTAVQAVKDTGATEVQAVKDERAAAIAEIDAKIDAVGWEVLPNGNLRVTIERSGE